MPITSFDFFNLVETPTFILCNPNKEQLYALGGISERRYSPRFNALSELSFRADEYINETQMAYYAHLVHRKLIYVAELGYFMIVGVSEKGDGITKYKEISCQSLEVEFSTKKLSLFEGTYKFYDVLNPDGTLLHEIMAYMPGWSIGSVDTDIAIKYRTFDVSDTTIYNFLMVDVEQAYECIFVFNTVNKTVSAYTTSNVTTATDIYISYDNLINSIQVEESTDELVTALTVLGGGDLAINLVNPLGTNNIYNFTYFKSTDWMSQTLIDRITAWEAVVNSYQTTYATHLANLLTYYEEMAVLETAMVELEAEYAALEVEKRALIQAGASLTSINAELTAKKAEVDAKQAEIDLKQAQINSTISSLETINDAVSFETNFTDAEIIQLQPFIIQSSYINDNFIQTDSMSPAEIQEMAQELYDQAVVVLAKISEPRYTFDVESVNFLALPEFQNFIDEFVLGAVINMEIKEGVVTYPVLLGFDLDYDDPTKFSLIFGNRLRLNDEAFQYSDLINEALKSSTNSKVNSLKWKNFDTNYKTEVSDFINSSLNASLNNVVSGSSQEIIIDKAGLRGRELDPITGEFSDDQIWLVNNMIAFTDDNWNTAKMAIGEIELDNGNSAWGVVADYLVGKMIVGQELLIQNEDSTFSVSGSQASFTNASLSITRGTGATGNVITLDPSTGISIKKAGTNVFYINSNGDLVMTGTITATAGKIGGFDITTSGIYKDSTHYLYSNGDMKWGGLSITGTTATFNGSIVATNFRGTVDWANVTNVPPSRISGGTMSGVSLYGATTLAGGKGTITVGGTGNFLIQSYTGFEISASGHIQITGAGTIGFYSSGGASFGTTPGGFAVYGSSFTFNGANVLTSSGGISGTYYYAYAPSGTSVVGHYTVTFSSGILTNSVYHPH